MKRISNIALYILALANLAYAIGSGFNWLTWVSLALAALVLVIDVTEAVKHGRK